MDWSLQVNLVAGIGALILGTGVLVRRPRRRDLHLALVCLALSVWTLAGAARDVLADTGVPWRSISLAGSYIAAPLSLHFVFVLTGYHGALRRLALAAAYTIAAVVWIPVWRPELMPIERSLLLALFGLGATFLLALGILLRATLTKPAGAERRAFGLLLAGGAVAVIGGLSDFLPRATTLPELPIVGPATLLVFLVVLSGLVVRHRFMDVDTFLARAVTLGAGAAAGGLLIFGVAQLSGVRFLPIAVATLIVLLASGRLGRGVLRRPRWLVRSRDAVAQALHEVSRLLPRAVDVDGIWDAILAGRERLPSDVQLGLFWKDDSADAYTLRFRTPQTAEAVAVPVADDAALPRLLAAELMPLTRSYLSREQQDSHGTDRHTFQTVLTQFASTDTDLVLPLQRNGALLGWVALSGGFPERDLSAEIATMFEAVANQGLACLERIRAIEQAKRREALAAVGELAGGLAHEVRNPLAAIRGAAQALGPAASPEQSREMLEVIDEESERLGRFLGEFLDYAKPAAPQREAVDLPPLVEQTLKAAKVSGLQFEADVLSADKVPAVLGDRDQLRRVLENLLRNACEAAGPSAQVQIELRAEAPNRLRLRFADNGPGIPEERMAQLFQPFQTTKPQGTGLGLAVVHRIVESHGGTIQVRGRPGQGAEFTILLPAAIAT